MTQISLVERVLGVTDPDNIELAMSQAHETLTGEPLSDIPPIYLQPQETTPDEELLPFLHLSVKRIHAMRHAADLLVHRRILSPTSLSDWNNYHQMMEQHGTKAKGPANALIIGVLNALSARSSYCLAQYEYGADPDQIFNLDLEYDPDKARHGRFVIGTALDLPFESKSINFVHTNRLVCELEDPHTPPRSKQEQIEQSAREIARVLKPGGQALMVETIPGSANPFITMKQLRQWGSGLIKFIGTAFGGDNMAAFYGGLARKSSSVDWLFDPRPNFQRGFTKTPDTVTIYIKKS